MQHLCSVNVYDHSAFAMWKSAYKVAEKTQTYHILKSPDLRVPCPQNNTHVIKMLYSIFRVSSLKLLWDDKYTIKQEKEINKKRNIYKKLYII